MGLRPAKPSLDAVPVGDAFSPSFQHSRMISAVHFAGKVEQADVEVLHLHADGVDLGQGVFDALQGLVAFGLAPRQMDDIDEMPPFRNTWCGQFLKLGVDCLDQCLASMAVRSSDSRTGSKV